MENVELVVKIEIFIACLSMCFLCYCLGKIIGKHLAEESSIDEIQKQININNSLRARYFRKVLKLHKINFVEHPTQEDLDNVISDIDLQKQSESDENNEA